jgi:hypothetical protein
MKKLHQCKNDDSNQTRKNHAYYEYNTYRKNTLGGKGGKLFEA